MLDRSNANSIETNCLIVGGGPAALAPLVAASREDRLDEVLSNGVVVVERSSSIGAGRIGDYVIWSDSTADSFLTAVKGPHDPRLARLCASELCCRFEATGYGPVSLRDAALLQVEVGKVLHDAIEDAGGQVYVRHDALYAVRVPHGWRTRIRCIPSGRHFDVESRSLVIGTGGYQPLTRLLQIPVAGVPLLPRYRDKLIQSDDVVQPGGIESIRTLLRQNPSARVVIVGGSTSAVAVADLLLREFPTQWSSGAITILHRRPLRIFFKSVEEALANGYTDFNANDVCPVTGLVYRLAGLRQRSRELLIRILGVGVPRDEARVVLHQIEGEDDPLSRDILDNADIIVAALGYRPRGLPLYNVDGSALPLLADINDGALVDDQCRLLGRDGATIPGAFGIGLASGFELDARMGGEPSFRGQANGLWLWQNDIGSRIATAMLDTSTVTSVAEHAPQDHLFEQALASVAS